jgi:DNA-binding XRE family transcriptional regulator
MARVKKIDHDSWKGRTELQAKAETAALRLPGAVVEIRLALGLSQEEFAKAFKITRRNLSNIENGRGNPSLETLEKIGRPLGLVLGYVPRSMS